MQSKTLVDLFFKAFLSAKTKELSERFVLIVAIASYLIHLALIFLSKQGYLPAGLSISESPIAAIYTPFSFILIYEVYLLIFFLPKSTSYYIGKQYEIITLIVIRRIFKDLAEIELSSDWFQIQGDLQFTYDSISSLILFGLILLFYQNINKRNGSKEAVRASDNLVEKVARFVYLKKAIAVLLVPVLIGLSVYSFYNWAADSILHYQNGVADMKNINHVFFDEFFGVLIIVDVLLLLASFFYTDRFHLIIRNSGFVISTILIKVSFSVSGLINNALILGSVLFGLGMLLIYNLYERNLVQEDKN